MTREVEVCTSVETMSALAASGTLRSVPSPTTMYCDAPRFFVAVRAVPVIVVFDGPVVE